MSKYLLCHSWINKDFCFLLRTFRQSWNNSCQNREDRESWSRDLTPASFLCSQQCWPAPTLQHYFTCTVSGCKGNWCAPENTVFYQAVVIPKSWISRSDHPSCPSGAQPVFPERGEQHLSHRPASQTKVGAWSICCLWRYRRVWLCYWTLPCDQEKPDLIWYLLYCSGKPGTNRLPHRGHASLT